MLVLERRLDEQIVIGRDIVLTVCEIRYDRVRLGVAAPKEIPVHREEVQAQVDAEKARQRATGRGTR